MNNIKIRIYRFYSLISQQYQINILGNSYEMSFTTLKVLNFKRKNKKTF